MLAATSNNKRLKVKSQYLSTSLMCIRDVEVKFHTFYTSAEDGRFILNQFHKTIYLEPW
jgi:hypothetical protein